MIDPEHRTLLVIAEARLRIGFLLLFSAAVISGYGVLTNWQHRPRAGCGVVDRPVCGNELRAHARNTVMEELLGRRLDPLRGERIFKGNCASCHTLDRRLTGPAMKGVLTRCPQPAVPWLKALITNEDSLLNHKDIYLLKLRQEYGTSWQHRDPFSSEELDQLLGYIAR
jgi:hypothetical protein